MDSKKKIVITLLLFGVVFHLSVAILCGRHGEWFMFGLSLTSCVLMTTFLVGVLLAWKIDSRFNQLEKTIREGQQPNKEEKSIERDTHRPAEA